MANYEATRYDFSGGDLQGLQGVNTGIIVPWGLASTPSGFLACDGTAVSRTTYADLFAVVGTNYGVGDGSTTFNLPDLTDRTVVGKSPTKAQYSTGGANTVVSTGNVGGSAGPTSLSTPTIASHSHVQSLKEPIARSASQSKRNMVPYDANSFNSTQGTVSPASSANTGGGSGHSHPIAGTFTGDATSVLQPFSVVRYIIKT